MSNLAKELKRKRDAEARLRQLDPAKNILYSGEGSIGGSAGGYIAPADLLNEAAHDLLDHAGLTGVPSITGLLDETAHDALDHTGLTGVATDFIDLGDVPAAYGAGDAGKVVVVNATEDGLAFDAAPAATNGVPIGGTTNQLAAKNSNADYDMKWMDAPAAANGLPAGGTAGQVLAKVDEDDYDTEWITPSAIDATNGKEVVLSTTGATTIATRTPAAAGNVLVGIYFRVITATTNVTAVVTYTDATGAQTNTLLSVQACAVGSYSLVPVFINTTAAAIIVTITAGTANQVYGSASIMEVG